MTQNPYLPPQPYHYAAGDAYESLRSPAKRASILMFILGGLLCVCGTCCVAAGPMLSRAQLDAEQMSQFSQFEAELGIGMKELMMGMGVAGMLPGIILIVLGIFVRGGSTGPVITALVFTSIMELVLLLLAVSGGIEAISSGSPDTLIGLAFFIALLATLGMLIVWLIQSVRNAGQLRAWQTQYQMQYWQYQQQQQLYQRPPAWSNQPPPPPPPPPQAS